MKFKFDQYIEASRRSSMDYWYPLTAHLPVPQPRTIPVLTMDTNEWCDFLDSPGSFSRSFKELTPTADELGYPLFIRTDQSSAKHTYENTCCVMNKDQLYNNIYQLIEENIVCDLNVQTLYFRKFIKLNSTFTAFNKMPIAPERRYFVNDGKVLCHHPYWPQDAIDTPDHEDWRSRLHILNTQNQCEVETLTKYAMVISLAIPGTWSVDFAQARDGTWYFIDMADARLSWHPENCPNYVKLSLEDPSPPPKNNIQLVRIDGNEDELTKETTI